MSIQRHTFYNLAGSTIPMAVAFVTVPLYLHKIGEARYGVLAIVWLLLGYFGLFDLGLSRATANRIAQLKSAPSVERGRVFWTSLGLNAGFGMLGGAVLYGVAGIVLGHFFKMPDFLRREVLSTLPWLAAIVPLATVSGVLTGTLEGREQFGIVNVLQVFGSMLFNITPLAVAYLHGPDLRWLIPAAILARATSMLPLWVAVAKTLPFQGRAIFARNQVKPLLTYGGWVTVNGVLDPLFSSFDSFLIGSALGVSAVTLYNVPYQLVRRVHLLSTALTRTLFPRFSSQSAMDAKVLGVRAISSLAAISLPLMVLTTLILYPFMDLWVGHGFAVQSSPVGEILVLSTWMSSMAFVPYAFLQGQGRPRTVALLHVAEAPLLIGAVWLGVHFDGLQGAAWAMLFRNTMDSLALLLYSGLLWDSAVRLGKVAAGIAISLVIARIIGPHFVYRIAAAAVLFTASCAWLLYFDPDGKQSLKMFRTLLPKRADSIGIKPVLAADHSTLPEPTSDPDPR